MADLGRPLMYKTAEALGAAIGEYFEKCDKVGRPYTIAGLAYELGFTDRHALQEYEKRDPFSATIKRARGRIEMQRSERLVSGDGNMTGMIFDLKNNFGWKDKTETEQTVTIRHEDALSELE